MKAIVRLRRLADGVEREFEDTGYSDAEGLEYWWTEGNGSCDCNRHTYFERAAGIDGDHEGLSCGENKLYALVKLAADGRDILGSA